MGKFTRSLTMGAVFLAACAFVAISAAGVGAKSKSRADSGTAYISIVHQSGQLEYAAGYNVDKLFGATGVTYVVSVGVSKPGVYLIKAKTVTLYTADGALTGTGSATQTITPTAVTVTNGKLSLTHGSGGQKGHSMIATFTGTYDPKTSVYTFHYKGNYQ
jgi:hypothetical protein